VGPWSSLAVSRQRGGLGSRSKVETWRLREFLEENSGGGSPWVAPTLFSIDALAHRLGWTRSTVERHLSLARRTWADRIDQVRVGDRTFYGANLAARSAARPEAQGALVCRVWGRPWNVAVTCKRHAAAGCVTSLWSGSVECGIRMTDGKGSDSVGV
jgi:hypothetical protein